MHALSGHYEREHAMNGHPARTNPAVPLHPNEFDRRRIARALENRKRYRYVTPEVQTWERGYLIRSSCCSRNIDPEGGVIDIAKLEFHSERHCWWLYHKDHEIDHWIRQGEFLNLADILDLLNQDPDRRFWQ